MFFQSLELLIDVDQSRTLDYMDIGPYNLPETFDGKRRDKPPTPWVYLEISPHHSTRGDFMADDFLRHRRKTEGVPWSLHTRRSTVILTSPLAGTSRVQAAPEGPFDLWGEGVWRQCRIGEPSQTLTSVRLTDGDGAAGLPGRD
jgi:hypothetical protein